MFCSQHLKSCCSCLLVAFFTAAFELSQGSTTFAEADIISFGLLLEINLLLVTFGSASSVVSANCCYVLLTHSKLMRTTFARKQNEFPSLNQFSFCTPLQVRFFLIFSFWGYTKPYTNYNILQAQFCICFCI